MKLKEVEEKYRDEWVLAEVLKEDESGEPIEGGRPRGRGDVRGDVVEK